MKRAVGAVCRFTLTEKIWIEKVNKSSLQEIIRGCACVECAAYEFAIWNSNCL